MFSLVAVPINIVLSPGFVSRVHQVLDVIVGGHCEFGQILNIRPHQRVLSDAEVSFVFGIQQVAHALTVDLHVAHLRARKRRVSEKHFVPPCVMELQKHSGVT